MKKLTPKMFLMLYEIKLFNLRFKKLLLFSDVFIVDCICWLHCLLHFTSPLWCYTASATDLRELFLLSGVFYLTLLHDIWYNDRLHQPALLSRFPCSLPFCLECGCRASHYGSKHRPGPTACLNHTVFSKRY